jgi:Undecaprenyl-phosphate glucose phosphotransferase
MDTNSHPFRSKLFYIADTAVIITAMAFSWWYKKMIDPNFTTSWQNYLFFLIGIIPIYLVIYFAFDFYSSKRGMSFGNEIVNIIEANIMGCLILFGIFFVIKLNYISRIVIIQFTIANTVLIIIERYTSRLALKYLRARGFNLKHMLIIGAGDLGLKFLKKIEKHREYGFSVMGFLDDDESKLGSKIGRTSVIGKIEMLDSLLPPCHIEEVVVALPLSAYQKLSMIIKICEKHGVRVLIIPDYYSYIPAKPKVAEIDGIPVISIRDIPLDTFLNRLIKRLFDMIMAMLLLVISAPVMIIIAFGVKFTSRGPILFKQKRIGLNRKPFFLYKFRSMRVSSDEVAATTWTTSDDRRRTRFGEFIRRTSLDELPQFFNVLKGDMSLVGPRPERPFFVEKFKDEIPKYMVKHQIKPGITGWAQVNGWRGDTSIEERIKCDIYYVENWSLMLDFKIVLLTIFKGFINKNAY